MEFLVLPGTFEWGGPAELCRAGKSVLRAACMNRKRAAGARRRVSLALPWSGCELEGGEWAPSGPVGCPVAMSGPDPLRSKDTGLAGWGMLPLLDLGPDG